jgi:Do/DeqQ family serine protease
MRLSALARAPGLLVLIAALAAGPVAAQTRAAPEPARPGRLSPDIRVAPESKAQVQLSFAPVVRKASPAVVNVYGAARQTRQNATMEEFFRRYFGDDAPSAPRGRSASSVGSGVIVDPAGLVVTNHHVIEGMTEVRVALADGREFEADVVLRDPRSDLAMLRLKDARDVASLELGDSEALEVGDLVLAIGNPFGVGQTVTQGIVSALARTQVGISDYQFFVQTDAAINPGNSGGALVDMDGRLVGINTAIFSRSGGSHGIGFAIPSTMVRAVIESAKGGSRTVRRPWLGARLQGMTREIAETLGLERPTGVLVTSVYDMGPAHNAGIRRGDAILAVENQPIDSPEAFGYRFALRGIEGETSLTILRSGRRETVTVKLMTPPETRPRDPVRIRSRSPLAGATLVNMSPAVADEFQIDVSTDGVVVAELDETGAAARVGFQKGDAIVAVNGQRLATTKEAERLMTRSGSGYWEITVNRGGRVFTTTIGG